jgi:spectinomycin phosphotransferase
MLERPKLADDAIIGRLRAEYDLVSPRLEFLPIGNDARAWAFRIETDAGKYFLKLRRGAPKLASLFVPHHLRNCGVKNVVAPIPANTGQLYALLGEYTLMVYPFVHGKSEWNMALTAAQWREWGALMRSIHDAPIPARLVEAVQREVFAVKWLDTIESVEAAIAHRAYAGEVADSVAGIWRAKSDVIELCRSRYLSLGRRMENSSADFVFCHADIHTANIIIDDIGGLHIVDWDETLLAPKERDLMFFIDDGRSMDTTEAFLAGYGCSSADLLALAYYKYDWVIQELGDYGERVFIADNLSGDELALAQREFARLFAAGDVIDRAHRAFANLVAR